MSKIKGNVMVFVPDDKDKENAIIICSNFIDVLDQYEIGFKAFVLQKLLESFEENFDIDIRNGVSITKE